MKRVSTAEVDRLPDFEVCISILNGNHIKGGNSHQSDPWLYMLPENIQA